MEGHTVHAVLGRANRGQVRQEVATRRCPSVPFEINVLKKKKLKKTESQTPITLYVHRSWPVCTQSLVKKHAVSDNAKVRLNVLYKAYLTNKCYTKLI